ncbi:hypothetical protein B296_00026120 [Ensete ventricosum]|uniref:Uncharacterized protein n=1 Tax=Ensete ventricosum TaxID=4639 RepID=A0A427A0F6_ENSVE|nr:hypothetical protein B296_00026120 [Ensete ventricosum]
MVGFCCGVQWTPSQNTLHGREAGTRGFVGSTTSARSAECTPGADEQQTEAPAMAVGGRGSAAYSLHAVLSRPPNPRLRRQAALLDRSLVHRTESNPTFAVEFLLRPPAWIKGYQDGEILDSSARAFIVSATGRSYLRSLLYLLLTMPSYFTTPSVVLAARRATCFLQLWRVDLAHLTRVRSVVRLLTPPCLCQAGSTVSGRQR